MLVVRCPNCGQKTEGDYCRWCGYPVLAGGSGRMEAGKAKEEEARARRPETQKSNSKLKESLKGCGCLLTLAVIVGIIIALTSNGDSNYIYENGAILVGGDGEPIELINNLNATDPTYAELIAFIEEDTTDEHHYFTFSYVCSDFAEDVHNNAEAAGIRAAWVGIDLEGDDEGHALNAFETTDRGLVYIDCTGQDLLSGLQNLRVVETGEGFNLLNNSPTSWDAIAYIEVDKEYGLIPIAKAESLLYSFYEEYKQKWQEYEELVSEYNAEVIQYNEEISGKIYIEGSPELAMIEAWEASLKEKEEVIDKLSEELGDYWFELPGIVTDIYIHW
jgi:hypothetical protein